MSARSDESSGSGSSKISLALLKARTAGQSVPSISFRFNTASDDITEVYSANDDEALQFTAQSNSDATSSFDKTKLLQKLRKFSTADEITKEATTSMNSDQTALTCSVPVPVSNASTFLSPGSSSIHSAPSPGLLSRLSKSLEHKIQEIRQEKVAKEREREFVSDDEAADGGSDSLAESSLSCSEKSFADSRTRKYSLKRSFEKDSPVSFPSSISLSNSPSRKSGLSQELSDIRSELGKTIPKLSELRIKKQSSKDLKKSGFNLNSLLGRDDGLPIEELLSEENEGVIEAGVEAEEGILLNSSDVLDSADHNLPSGTYESPAPTKHVQRDESGPSIPSSLDIMKLSPISNEKSKSLVLREVLAEAVELLTSYYWLIALLYVSVAFILPSFISGFICGASVVCALSVVIFKIVMNVEIKGSPSKPSRPSVLYLPFAADHCQYTGWLNELDGAYCPENYHVSLTHSVLARLQGSKLLIDHPRCKVTKHARFNEGFNSGGFVHHREYNLEGATVLLLPRNLPRRWLWSRKYPICIRLPSPCNREPSHFPAGSPHTDESSISEGVNDGDVSAEDCTTELDTFEQVTEEMCCEKTLYFFARSDREKDDWFRRLVAACGKSKPSIAAKIVASVSASSAPGSVQSSPPHHVQATGAQSGGGGDSSVLEEFPQCLNVDATLMDFSEYMAHLLQPALPCAAEVAWLNALFGRLFYDFLKDPYWANKIQERVQRKLSKLHLPQLVGELLVCGVHLGEAVPQLQSVGSPRQDNRGLWCDVNVVYQGNFTMTIETKIDLMKLKKSENRDEQQFDLTRPAVTVPRLHGYARSPSSNDVLLRDLQFDTDTDDSVESSSEEEGGLDEDSGASGVVAEPSGGKRKFMRIVDSVAASRYFQQVTEWRLLQKAFRGVSNTRIVLSVRVEHLRGNLTVNIPPQPSDRLWYGFKTPPELSMRAQPRLGDRDLNLPFLSDYIERQLREIFDKVFVLPNMDDLVVPIMSPLLPGQEALPRPPWETTSNPPQRAEMEEVLPIRCRGSAAASTSLPTTPDEH